MIVVTPALVAAAEREASINGSVLRLVDHLISGGDPRTPPPGWRPTYPMDDPANAPDLWIGGRSGDEIVWCKLDTHPPQGESAPCSWCGYEHVGRMDIYTFMLPSDY